MAEKNMIIYNVVKYFVFLAIFLIGIARISYEIYRHYLGQFFGDIKD